MKREPRHDLCVVKDYNKCPNMKFDQRSDSESYYCPLCGNGYKLYYEDMAWTIS